MYSELNQKDVAEVINHADSSASKCIHKLADSINEGTFSIEPSQQDVTGTAL